MGNAQKSQGQRAVATVVCEADDGDGDVEPAPGCDDCSQPSSPVDSDVSLSKMPTVLKLPPTDDDDDDDDDSSSTSSSSSSGRRSTSSSLSRSDRIDRIRNVAQRDRTYVEQRFGAVQRVSVGGETFPLVVRLSATWKNRPVMLHGFGSKAAAAARAGGGEPAHCGEIDRCRAAYYRLGAESERSDYLVRLLDCFATEPDALGVVYWEVTEPLSGPNLAALLECNAGPLDESDVRAIARDVLSALSALHGQRIAHNKLNLHSVVLAGEPPVAKLCNVHFYRAAGWQPADDSLADGNAMFLAPEVLRADCLGPTNDLWCAGVIVYKLLSGSYPFVGDTLPALFHAITMTEPDLASLSCSDHAKQLLRGLLNKNEQQRWTADQALTSHWFHQ